MQKKLSSKICFLIVFCCFLFLHCPKRVSVKTSRIEAIYLSSLLDDVQRPEPYLSSIAATKAIKIGYLNFETPFMSEIFKRLGFYELLAEIPLDFLITNYPVYGYSFLSIPLDFGYGIKNHEGIRFAICSKYRDSLSISDQVKLATIRERSDVLWIMDRKMLLSPALQIDFIIKDRTLQDTIIKKISTVEDTALRAKILRFNQSLEKILTPKINLAGKTIIDYIFEKVRQKCSANVFVYTTDFIKDNSVKDSVSIGEFLAMVDCHMKFRVVELTKSALNKMIKENGYLYRGDIAKTNVALVPDREGDFLFDLIFY